MLFEQRSARKEEDFAPTTMPWMHDSSDAKSQAIAQSCAWWYVVVDELVGDWVKLVFAPWPTLDMMGRLTFKKLGSSIWLDSVAVREYAKDRRELDRPLRISDVFAIYAEKGPSQIDRWKDFADITPTARESAKVAAFATRGDLMPPELAEKLAATGTEDDQNQMAAQQRVANSELPNTNAAAAV